MNPVDAFAVLLCLLLHHLTTVAYHRIYINAVVVPRGSFAAVFACLKPRFPAAKVFYDLRLDLKAAGSLVRDVAIPPYTSTHLGL